MKTRTSGIKAWWREEDSTVVWRVGLWIGLAAVLMVVAVSCVTGDRVLTLGPQIAGAEFAGSESCAQCHEDVTKDFHTAGHARLMAQGENAKDVGCETCHGPGSKHTQSGGAYGTILNPRQSPSVCFQCHVNLRGEFNLPHSHPVLAGQMHCGECHDPHRGPAHRGGGTLLASQNDVCLKCHPAQRGPHVFEHEATRDGCVSCHQPHGSVNAKMLAQRNANLCLKCHVQVASSNIQIGGVSHQVFLRTGTCWTAGCHEAVHGSQISSKLRY